MSSQHLVSLTFWSGWRHPEESRSLQSQVIFEMKLICGGLGVVVSAQSATIWFQSHLQGFLAL